MTIKFRVNDEGNSNYMAYDENMTVEDFIKDYLGKLNLNITLDQKVYTFKSQSKILNSPKYLKKRLCDVITNDGQIFFIKKQDTHYSMKNKYNYKI